MIPNVGGICGNSGAGFLEDLTGSFVPIYGIVAVIALGPIGASLALSPEASS